MQLDPTKIQLESHTPPIWEREEDFSQVMSDQLKHAPWLVISAIAHAIAGLILYMALDGSRNTREDLAMNMEMPEPEDDIEEEEEEEEEVEEEEVEEVEVQEVEITETEEISENVIDELDTDTVESAFDSNQWNTAIGLGGGAGGKWGGRRGGRKRLRGKKRGTARAIDMGLQWLKNHQDKDGKWDCDAFMKHDKSGVPCDGAGNPVHDVGITALALLAFLGDGSTMRSGPYKDQVKKSVIWLRRQQGPNGLFGTNASHDFVYDHAIAAYAMCEAYGLSKYKIIKKNAQNGINYLESHRNPYSCWRYQPRDNDNDSSVTGWAIMAYKSAKDFKLQVNAQALKISANFLDELTDPATGRCGYTKRGEKSSRHPGDHATRFPIEKGEALTAVGLFCRFFLGQDPKKVAIMKTAAETLMQRTPIWDKDGSIDHYYWYYATYALYQMGGNYWTEWSKKLTPAVVKQQREDGNFKGSWDAVGAWGEDGGRVYSTAILVLTLEAYYRYTRLVR
ncbi:MAG: prenyltransferase/squalene oxidase repeat-containing protein [Planctomycetota bacterium]|nr:prenyltransferase/squalene oxidase repeat-containing protein [Planctomycetota bacterium]